LNEKKDAPKAVSLLQTDRDEKDDNESDDQSEDKDQDKPLSILA
jgi:hypothetical protein